MTRKSTKWVAGILMMLLAATATTSGLPSPLITSADLDAAGDAEDMDVHRVEITLRPQEALLVTVDLHEHEMTLNPIPRPGGADLQTNDHTPNCLSASRLAWVQRDARLNLDGPGPMGQLGIPDTVGSCQWGAPIIGPPETLTFILVDREGGSVDGQIDDNFSFFVVECETSGAAQGSITGDDTPLKTATCEYRQNGVDPSEWNVWDSQIRVRGQTGGETSGFAYATFE